MLWNLGYKGARTIRDSDCLRLGGLRSMSAENVY